MQLRDWKCEGEQLLVGKTRLSDLFMRGQFRTPLYLYDADIIQNRISQLKQGFPNFSLLYSIKSNPTLAIAALMRDAGVGAEIVSFGELGLVRRVGFDLKKVAVTEPGKKEDDLVEYIDANVGLLQVDSEREILLVNSLSARRHVQTSVIVRVNPLHTYGGSRENMSGPSKFGISEEDVVDVIKRNQGEYIEFKGFHVFTGSQVLDYDILVKKFKDIARMSKELAHKSGTDLEHINFGGGFGVPYTREEQPLDIIQLGKDASRILDEEFLDFANKPCFYLELGRYLVAEAGIFLTKVTEVKNSRGTRFVITDSGINNFARPAMPWAMQHRCAVISKMNKKTNGVYKVVGSLCQPSDILCEEAELPEPEPGDIIAFFNAGVYGYTMSPQFYHSRDLPAEILYYQDDFHTIRPRLTYDELLSALPQIIPEHLKVQKQ
jgi:diaminopimelate decarboxylase